MENITNIAERIHETCSCGGSISDVVDELSTFEKAVRKKIPLGAFVGEAVPSGGVLLAVDDIVLVRDCVIDEIGTCEHIIEDRGRATASEKILIRRNKLYDLLNKLPSK